MEVKNFQELGIPLFGKSLQKAKETKEEKREVLVEEFLYRNTIVLVNADPGVGKSTLSAQIAVEAAAGVPVFGFFNTTRPLKVFYVQTERSIVEFLERIEEFEDTCGLNYSNIYATDIYQCLDLIEKNHADMFIDSIRHYCPDVDVIFIDPLYSCISGDLKDGVPASKLMKVMGLLQFATNGACIWMNHHTPKAQYSDGQIVDKQDKSYGSRWLRARATCVYNLFQTDKGTVFKKDKDNYDIHVKKVELEYNGENGLSTVMMDGFSSDDRIKKFLDTHLASQKPFYFEEVEAVTKLCTSSIRKKWRHSSVQDRLEVISSKRNKHLYKVVK